MNHETYSTYEAKARLSELLRKVRSGQVVTLTHRGEPIAEIRPIAGSESRLEDRLRHLASRELCSVPSRDLGGNWERSRTSQARWTASSTTGNYRDWPM